MSTSATDTGKSVPTLEDLPPAPDDKTGWPWTEQSDPLTETQTNGEPWPKISIVTPSYNQGRFIEETIRSVLLQGYPNLEYIVIDGGSTDETVEILEKYDSGIDYWVSEPDEGQSDAINKGFEMATGEIYAWLNSDDFYTAKALQRFANAALSAPESVVWAGACREIDLDRNIVQTVRPKGLNQSPLKQAFGDWWNEGFIHQPAACFASHAFEKVSGLDANLKYVMDADLWMRMTEVGEFTRISGVMAHARRYKETKTWENEDIRESEMIHVIHKNGMKKVAKKRLKRYGRNKVLDYRSNMTFVDLIKNVRLMVIKMLNYS